MNRHIPEDPKLWSSLVSMHKGTRRKTFCGVTSNHTGTPGLTHPADDPINDVLEETPNGLKYVWCPRCVLKWHHEVRLYIFPDTQAARYAKQKMVSALEDWIDWIQKNGTIEDWKNFRAR